MGPTLSPETSAFKLQTPGKFPEEYKLHSEHGESLKTTIRHLYGEETTRNIRLLETLRIKTMGQTLSPETSAFKLQTPGKFPEEYKLFSYTVF